MSSVGAKNMQYVVAPPAVQQLLFQEALLLSQGAFEDWLSLFTPDGTYWMPAEFGQTDHENHVSLVNDTPMLMETRVQRLGHPQLYSQQPMTRTQRVVSNMLVAGDGGGISPATVHSSFFCIVHRLRNTQVFGGSYEHELVQHEGELKIQRKIVRLVNCDVPQMQLGIPL